jgi:hypothetical protein
MDFATLFGPVATGVQSAITAVLPIAIPVLVTLSGVTIAIGVFRKFGVRR